MRAERGDRVEIAVGVDFVNDDVVTAARRARWRRFGVRFDEFDEARVTDAAQTYAMLRLDPKLVDERAMRIVAFRSQASLVSRGCRCRPSADPTNRVRATSTAWRSAAAEAFAPARDDRHRDTGQSFARR